MLRLLVLLSLGSFLFPACNDGADAGTTVTATTGGAANVAAGNFTAYDVEGTPLADPDIRITVQNAELDGSILVGQYMERQYKAADFRVEGNTLILDQSDPPIKQGHYIVYFGDKQGLQLIIGEDREFEISIDMADPLETIQIEGSKNNELFYEALKFEQDQQNEFSTVTNELKTTPKGTPEYEAVEARRKKLQDDRDAFLESLYEQAPNSLFTSFKRAGQNPRLRDIRLPNGQMDEPAQVEAYRSEFWDNVNFGDERLLRTPVINNKLKRYIKELTPQNAKAINKSADELLAKTGYTGKFFEFFANWITLQYEPGKSSVMDAEGIYTNMIQNYFTQERAVWSDSMTVYGLQQRADQMAHSLVGQKGPDITVPGLDGAGKRLFDSKKDYLIVYMYNPECDHCREQTPKLKQLYPQIKNEVDIYAIALDTNDEEWRKFVRDFGIQDWTNVFDPTNRSIVRTYFVDNTPELYLLNEEREIVAKNLKVEQILDAIKLDKNASL